MGERTARTFIALGATGTGSRERMADALADLADAGLRIAAIADPWEGPFVGEDQRPVSDAPRVLNTVVEGWTDAPPAGLLVSLHAIEARHGRVRDGRPDRALDLDLLAVGDRRAQGDVVLPHPRARERAFVLEPWAEIAPDAVLPGTARTVLELRAALRARRPDAFEVLERQAALPAPAPAATRRPLVLDDLAALHAWRAACEGSVGLVPTMGALHEGHASLLRRARAAHAHVLATLFVNPLQFGPGEDLARYPRTFEHDLDVLAGEGVDAVYAPAAADLYPPGFATYVEPEGPARTLEGARRPGHFRGVATVVLKLLLRTRPDAAVFGRKDAQQVAVVRRMVRDLDVDVAIEVGHTVRDADGLALSSRNRYLDPDQRRRALALPRTLDRLRDAVATGEHDVRTLVEDARRALETEGLAVDYVAVVDPDGMGEAPIEPGRPLLAVATVGVGSTHLLDNRWLVLPRTEALA